MSIDWEQTHLAQAVTLKSGSRWRFRLGVRRQRLQLSHRQSARADRGAARRAAAAVRAPSTASTAPAGTRWTPRACGRGWPDHELSFGAHRDAETFAQFKYNLADWIAGAPTSAVDTPPRAAPPPMRSGCRTSGPSRPTSRRRWAGAYEDWRAYDGINFSATPALNVSQPQAFHQHLLAQGGAGLAGVRSLAADRRPGAWPIACRR